MRPISSTTMDRTVANTGRRMQISGSVIERSALGLGRRLVALADRRRRRAVGNGHRNPLAQLDHARGPDDVVPDEAVHDLDAALAALADFHLLALRLALHHLVDVLVVAYGEERFLGNDDRVTVVAREEANAREHPWTQPSFPVRHLRA